MGGFLERYTVEGLEFDAGLRICYYVLVLTTVINFHCVKRKRKPGVSIMASIITIYDRKFNIDSQGIQTTWWASHAQLTKQYIFCIEFA